MAQPNLFIGKKVKHDLDYYLGKKTKVKILITDDKEEQYDTEFLMPKDWTEKKFSELIAVSMHMCEGQPVTVIIKEISHI